MRIYLGAVVDGAFITDTAEELLKRKEVLKVPVIMGITNHEFGWILPQVTQISVVSCQTLRHNRLCRNITITCRLRLLLSLKMTLWWLCSLSPGVNPDTLFHVHPRASLHLAGRGVWTESPCWQS